MEMIKQDQTLTKDLDTIFLQKHISPLRTVILAEHWHIDFKRNHINLWDQLVVIPLDEYKKKVASIIEEYLDTSDVDLAASELRELGSFEYHPYLIKRLVSMVMDRHDKEKEMTFVLLSALYYDVISPTQINQEFFMLLEFIDDLAIDIMDVVHEYFLSDGIRKLIKSLEVLGSADFNPVLLKKLITLAMDRKKPREGNDICFALCSSHRDLLDQKYCQWFRLASRIHIGHGSRYTQCFNKTCTLSRLGCYRQCAGSIKFGRDWK